MQKIPPIAPIPAKGPLGLAHLPRMWSKALQAATGQLADGYRTGCYFDRTLMATLGIDVQAALAFIQSNLPTYLEYEAWVLEQAGGHLEPERIEAANRAILGHELEEAERLEFLQELGLPAETTVRGTAELEQLDDWAQFHRLLTNQSEA